MTDMQTEKNGLNDWLFEQTKGIVQTGPFAGMKMIYEETNWRDGNLGTKMLGCYEQELHQAVEEEIARLAKVREPTIVNIGCAEGYYAVGLARRLPQAIVAAIDIDPEALRITKATADLNGVNVQVITNGDDGDAAMAMPDLVVSDCEGAEVDYLNPDRFPSLLMTTMIVECHNNAASVLVPRFTGTHNIWGIEEGWRDPNKFECLRNLHSHKRWLAISEGRPSTMHWLVMRPK